MVTNTTAVGQIEKTTSWAQEGVMTVDHTGAAVAIAGGIHSDFPIPLIRQLTDSLQLRQ
jgi:hypothetical protein